MVKLTVILDPEEADVLARWAASELRDPREQIRFVLRAEFERLGLLSAQANLLITPLASQDTHNQEGNNGAD